MTQNANGTVTTYGYDDANRLTSVNGQAYTWDANGNLLSDGLLTYSYDQANRLKEVTQGANRYTFAYNGVGDRLSQTVGITTTRYVLHPAAGLTQVLSDGTNTYLYGNGRLAQYQANMQYFGPDGLGSVRQMYDASGQVIATNRYDPYGSLMSHSGDATSVFGYTGEQWDAATQLEYLRARYYSPSQARFTTRDVWAGNAELAQSVNRFSYVRNNPARYLDPSGHCDIDECPSTYEAWAGDMWEEVGVAWDEYENHQEMWKHTNTGFEAYFAGNMAYHYYMEHPKEAAAAYIESSAKKEVTQYTFAQMYSEYALRERFQPWDYADMWLLYSQAVCKGDLSDPTLYIASFIVVGGIQAESAERAELPEVPLDPGGEKSIRNVYQGKRYAPNYPQDFTPKQGGLKKYRIKQKELLANLRKVERGKWVKVMEDGTRADGTRVSLHYNLSPSGKVHDFDVKPGWSN